MNSSYVVTGGGQGVGRAIVERLLDGGDCVVVVELDAEALASWTDGHAAGPRLIPVVGDASDEAVTGRAADLAEEAGTLTGWVNNAAIFRDASLHVAPAREVLALRPGGAGRSSTCHLIRRRGPCRAPSLTPLRRPRPRA